MFNAITVVSKDPKRRKRRLKRLFGYLHLWLGLVAGIIVFISMIGAAIFVWEEELTHWYYAELIYADEQGGEKLPPSTLYKAVSKAYPGKEFTFMFAFKDPAKNYAIRSYKAAEKAGWTWPSGIEHYDVVYINPYTGKVAGHIDKRKDWITLTRFLHQTLLLKYEVGTQVIGAAALIMIIQALSGLILWWPKNKKVLIQRLKVKWKARFKRLNWDIHSVGGFYTYVFLIFFASTGLVWTYQWWNDGVYRLFGNDPKEVFQQPDPPEIAQSDFSNAMDMALEDATMRQPNWEKAYLSIPAATRKKGTISVGMYYKGNSWWDMSDYYYYDPNQGGQHYTLTHEQKLTGEKWRHSNYAMHVGSIYGLPTKIIAFICALFFATLPVTGFLAWWGRRNKKSARITIRKSKAMVN